MTFDLHCTTTAWFRKCFLFKPMQWYVFRSLHDDTLYHPHHSRHNRCFLFVVEWKSFHCNCIGEQTSHLMRWEFPRNSINSTGSDKSVRSEVKLQKPGRRRRESNLTTRVQIKHTNLCSELPVLSCLFWWCVSFRHLPMYATLHPAKIDSVAHKSAVEWRKYIFSFIILPNHINHFLRYSDSFSPRVLRVVVCVRMESLLIIHILKAQQLTCLLKRVVGSELK